MNSDRHTLDLDEFFERERERERQPARLKARAIAWDAFWDQIVAIPPTEDETAAIQLCS